MKIKCPVCNKRFGRKALEQHIAEAHDKIENRFKCFDDCVQCCVDSTMPITLTIGDIKRLSDFLKIRPREVFSKYCIIGAHQAPKPFPITNFFPILDFLRPCKFLKDNQCSVYNARPTVCKIFPYTHRYETSRYPYINYRCIEKGLINFSPKESREFEEIVKNSEKESKQTREVFKFHKYKVQLQVHQINQLLPEFNRITGLSFKEVVIENNQYEFRMGPSSITFNPKEHLNILTKLVHELAILEVNKLARDDILMKIGKIT